MTEEPAVAARGKTAQSDEPGHDEEVATMTGTVKDPVCGMEIRPDEAVASEEHDGRVFYFCSETCHRAFLADPHIYGHPEGA
jgi:Cu+-exporting ATPase